MDYRVKDGNKTTLDDFLSHMVIENGIPYKEAREIYHDHKMDRNYSGEAPPDEMQKVLTKYYDTCGINDLIILG